MTIEATLERIAAALESIAAGGGTVAPAADKKAPPAKKASTKKASTNKRVGTEDVGDPEITKEMVRAKLQELQKATTPAQAKSILKSHGASTIGNLPASKYGQVIDECDAKLAE